MPGRSLLILYGFLLAATVLLGSTAPFVFV